MSNVDYSFNGFTGYGRLPNGMVFLFDTELYHKISSVKWYPSYEGGRYYLIDRRGRKMHSYLLTCPDGYEVDHISLDTLDNRLANLRICTHQQNQCNQPLQRNNTSGIVGVSYYPPRKKYRARIKAGQHDLHLGYYSTLLAATQARNVGMECMFGEYGRYNNVPDAPEDIRSNVINICKRFAEFSICEAFTHSTASNGSLHWDEPTYSYAEVAVGG